MKTLTAREETALAYWTYKRRLYLAAQLTLQYNGVLHPEDDDPIWVMDIMRSGYYEAQAEIKTIKEN